MSAPFTHPDRLPGAEASGSNHPFADSSSRGRGGRGRGRGASSASLGYPGSIPAGSISKLKSQLRQTKRLLAREDLTPDVRTTSERRLATLELELEKTSNTELEKKMVTRYRGIRFFERQKVLRKIKQTKKALLTASDDPTLLRTLLESRIDLYYILQYPKVDKYIALFPEGTYVPHSPFVPSTKKDAASSRAAMREALRKGIESGELGVEAEGGDLGIEGEEDVGSGPAGEEVKEVKEVVMSKKRAVEEVEEKLEEEVVEVEARPAKKSKKVKEVVQVILVPEVVEEIIQVVEEGVVEEDEEDAGPQKGRQTKKEKKDLKDKKRKEKKEAEAKAAADLAAAPVAPVVVPVVVPVVAKVAKVAGKGKPAKKVVTAAKPAAKEDWAGQDDFFA